MLGLRLGLEVRVGVDKLCVVENECGDQVLGMCDKNGDGVIDYDEFVDLMGNHCATNTNATVQAGEHSSDSSTAASGIKPIRLAQFSKDALARCFERLTP